MTVSYALAVLGFEALLVSGAAAQVVRVRVWDQGRLRSVAGALASLRQDPVRLVAQALTDDYGQAVLTAPRPGRFMIRIDRIGYLSTTTDFLALSSGDTLVVEIEASSSRLILPDLTVTSSAPVVCRLKEGSEGLVATLWAEAKKALTASELFKARLPMLDVIRYEREYAPLGSVAGETAFHFQTDSLTPFVAAEAAHLARNGYLERTGQGNLFYAPDARVLLSDEFLGQHCFQVVSTSLDSTLIGLGFEPHAGRKRTDVAGTLWLDRATAELRFLVFTYTNIGKEFQSGHEGGRIDFVRLPSGGWIVGRWRARVGWHERGGEVAVREPVRRTAVTTFAGAVFDSLAGAPLPNVVVSTAGGAYVDTTDRDGRYRIQVPAEGQFTLSVTHPRFSLLGVAENAASVAAIRGQEVRVDFAVPGAATLAGQSCARRRVAPDSESLLVGRVTDSTGAGFPSQVAVSWDTVMVLRPGYRMRVSERGTTLVMPTDLAGRFRVCGIPSEIEVRITALARGRLRTQKAKGSPGGVALAELTLP